MYSDLANFVMLGQNVHKLFFVLINCIDNLPLIFLSFFFRSSNPPNMLDPIQLSLELGGGGGGGGGRALVLWRLFPPFNDIPDPYFYYTVLCMAMYSIDQKELRGPPDNIGSLSIHNNHVKSAGRKYKHSQCESRQLSANSQQPEKL